jgi:hypothetical protein
MEGGVGCKIDKRIPTRHRDSHNSIAEQLTSETGKC